MLIKKTYKFTSTTLALLLRIGFLVGLTLIAVVIYQLLIGEIFDGEFLIPLLILWVFTSYVVLPRIHRFLTKLYIPNYYIGRTRTADGLYGDPVNLAFYGSEKDIIRAMEAAGWHRADELGFSTSVKMSVSSVFRKSYPNAPVSSLFLFSRKQDLAFQQEVNGNPHSRHHIRFWKTPKGWRLPGGHDSDWLGAATFDTNVGLSWFTLQFTHRIDEHIDNERDYVIQTLKEAKQVDNIEVVENFTTAYHSRNGGGDAVRTDGAMPFITIKKS